MTQRSNIDIFRIYAGTVFARLYEQFPLSARLDVSDLVEHCQLAPDATSRASQMELVMETLRWLEDTGYVRFNEQPGTYDLTPRGFEALTTVPDPVSGICHGDRLRKLARTVGSETVSKTLAEIATQVFGAGIRAAWSIAM